MKKAVIRGYTVSGSRLVITVLFTAILSAASLPATRAQAPPDLGTAAGFAVLGSTAVTCTSSTIAGDVGVDRGAVSGCTVLGATHVGDAVAQQAYTDFLDAYAAVALVPCGQTLTGDFAGVTLPPGVYCFESAAAPTGTLTLDGASDGIWIFKIGTVDPAGYLAPTGFNVVMPGGSSCSNSVFWWTAQYATLTTSTVLGTILAGTSVTVTGGNLDGRALATGPVTLTGAIVGWPAISVPPVTGASINICSDTAVTLAASEGYVTYQWLFNGSPIPGAATSTLAATVSGNYSVRVTDANGCAGISADHAVTIVFCSTSEVSPMHAVFPARLTKSAAGNYVYFQRIDGITGYNLYEGNMGAWYSHGGAAGNVCGAVVTDLNTGEMRTSINPSEGDHYYLVTAYADTQEGPSGFASSGLERNPAQNTCAPP
jgi:type VI secretion system secreted protein VgrG